MNQPVVTALYRYPVKGLAPDPLTSVALEPGKGLPYDRAWAIENGSGKFNPQNPKFLPKINFLMLMRDERLATLSTRFDDDGEVLTILRDGKQVARGSLALPIGRTMLEQFFAAYMKAELRGSPKIVSAAGHTFSDVGIPCVHIINLSSLRELERVAGKPLDPIRFRANIVIDGAEPWSEFTWLEKKISIGDVEMRVIARTERCEATNVNPQTATRDAALPQLLQRTWQHSDFGVYATIKATGTVAVGNTLTLPE